MILRKLMPKIMLVITELFTIVLGILIALAANDWYKEREAKQLTETALTTLYEEISTNREAVVIAHNTHAERLAILLEALEDEANLTELDAERAFQELHQRGVYQPASSSIDDNAWLSAKLSNAVQRLPYERTLLFVSTYKSQENYRMVATQDIASLSSIEQGEEGSMLRLKEIYEKVNNLWWIETSLIESYDRILSTRDKKSSQPEK